MKESSAKVFLCGCVHTVGGYTGVRVGCSAHYRFETEIFGSQDGSGLGIFTCCSLRPPAPRCLHLAPTPQHRAIRTHRTQRAHRSKTCVLYWTLLLVILNVWILAGASQNWRERKVLYSQNCCGSTMPAPWGRVAVTDLRELATTFLLSLRFRYAVCYVTS